MTSRRRIQFHETAIAGAFVLDLERYEDERGVFAIMWSPEQFRERGLATDLAQCSIVLSQQAGTLRGMHHQVSPHEQVKLVRCSRGAIYDVVIDLRRDSPSYKRWIGVELTPTNNRVLYAPRGVAHGYQTLVDDTEVVYLVAGAYSPAHERGVRWNDPAFSVEWPDPGIPRIVNSRDAAFEDFSD